MQTEKKTYSEPTLTTHGDVQTQTQGQNDPRGSGPIIIHEA